jgi:glutamyl-tRNA reductase
LRRAAHRARARGPLPPAIDRALDGALRAGRRARTWLPRRGGLAELALGRIAQHADWSRPVLVVGAGAMGRRASDALTVRGARLLVASRTPERARLLAHDSGGRAGGFDPGPLDLASVGGVVIALAGTWLLTEPSRRALADGSAWVIDLSAPGALEAQLATRLGARLVTIDDLAQPTGSDLSAQLLERLDRLVEETLGEHRHWLERDRQRTLARALAERASEAQRAELDALWRRLPELAPEQRGEVERMAHHLTERLLRDPLEQLDEDRDGARALAARELFRL